LHKCSFALARMNNGYVPLSDRLMRTQVVEYGRPAARSLLRPTWWLFVVWAAVALVFWRWTNWWSSFDKAGDGTMMVWFQFPVWFQVAVSLVVGLLPALFLYAGLIVSRRFGRGT